MTDIQSLWVTTWCGSELQHKSKLFSRAKCSNMKQFSTASQSSHQLITSPTEDMDDMLLTSNINNNNNNNHIYILNTTSCRYGEIDVNNLFGSPAGRAMNNFPTKLCKSSTKVKSHQREKGIMPIVTSSHTNLENKLIQSNNNEFKYSTTLDKSKTNLEFKSNNLAEKKTRFWKFLDENKHSLDELPKTNEANNTSTRWKRKKQKSTSELYREATQLLGLSCKLSDSCRCLDCQGQYFDCNDSDSYSDYSTDDFDNNSFDNNNSHYVVEEEFMESTEFLEQVCKSTTEIIQEFDRISNYELLNDLSSATGVAEELGLHDNEPS